MATIPLPFELGGRRDQPTPRPLPAWLQNYRQASFRGAIFYVDAVDSQFGRRVVTHEYPDRSVPFSEDLGRKAREFAITGYLVGPGYQTQRDALIDACEAPGAAELVHPYMGALMVVLTDFTVRERRQDGGYCEVAMKFVEDGENQFPAAIINTGMAVDAAANAAQDAAESVFESIYNIDKLPEFVRREMNTAVNGLLDPLDRLLSTANDLADEVLAFRRDALTLINRPSALADGFRGVINRVTTVVGKNRSSSAALREMSTNALPPISVTTATRARQARSQDALQTMVQQLAIAEQARVTAGQPYDSYQDALEARQQLTDEIDTASETAADDVFVALQDLRAQVVQSLPDPRLPEIKTITLTQAAPALVVAYRAYGDPLRDVDVVARNKIEHPGFVPGGRPIEVVVNG